MRGLPIKLLIVIGVVLVAAGGAIQIFSQEIGPSRIAARSNSRIAETALGQVEFAEQGEGPVLLSIHGAGGGYDQGLALARDLVGGGYRIIAPSRFGYLRSPIPADTSTEVQADTIAALMDELKIDRAIVLGVSAGALSATELAIRHPERVSALLLIVPASYDPDSPVTIEDNRGNRIVFWLVNNGADFTWWALEHIAPSILYRFVGVPPELVADASADERDRAREIVHSIQPLSLRFPGIQIDSMNTPRERPLESITAPALIVSARDDLFNTAPAARHAAGRIPGAQLIVFEDGGHLLVGRQAQTRDAVAKFLKRTGISGQNQVQAVK